MPPIQFQNRRHACTKKRQFCLFRPVKYQSSSENHDKKASQNKTGISCFKKLPSLGWFQKNRISTSFDWVTLCNVSWFQYKGDGWNCLILDMRKEGSEVE